MSKHTAGMKLSGRKKQHCDQWRTGRGPGVAVPPKESDSGALKYR